MKILIVLVVVAVLLGLFVFSRARVAPTYSVRADQIPSVVARLYGLPEGKNGTWVVFMFSPPSAPPDQDAINLQYSVEQGSVGLDWVPISSGNIADREKIAAFA